MNAGDPSQLRLICPEYRLPGGDIAAKWENALAMGFDGIELAGPASSIHERFDELRQARKHGAVFPTVSGGGRPFIGEMDQGQRSGAIANLKLLLSAIAELGGIGVTTPACFGLYSNAIPALKPPSRDAGRAELIDALAEVGEHAGSAGVTLLLEPLNRYEDHFINKLGQAIDLLRQVNSPPVRLLADVFHLNIEEADVAAAIRQAGPYIHHVQLADSNRLEPGAGHLDLIPIFSALSEIGFGYYCALECSLSAEPHAVLPRVTKHLRMLWQAAARQGAGA